MKKLLLTMILCLCGIAVNAQEVNINGIQYYLTKNSGLGENFAAVMKGGDYKGDITIPATVTYEGVTYNVSEIWGSAFYNCTELTSITLPSSIETVGNWSFEGCTGLTTVTFPEGVRTIHRSIFYNCTNLTSVTFPESVGYIDDWIFEGCSSLETVTLPKEVEYFGKGVFWGCGSLTEVNLPKGIREIGESTFCNCCGLTSITIPSGVASMGNYAFVECDGLTSIVLPEGLEEIGECAFFSCSGLTSIDIPSSVTSIGDQAFSDCTSLESINIPKGVTTIGVFTFVGCSNLATVTIPEGITTIGEYAFNYCTNLEMVVLPESLTHIGKEAFASCKNLTSITFPKSMESFDEGILWDCTELTFVKLPEIDTIAAYTLYGCSNLETLVLPASLKSIQNWSFTSNKLHDVYCYAQQAPTVEYSSGLNLSEATLHVPATAIESYRATAPWSNSKQIVALTAEDDESFTVKVNSVTISQISATLIEGETIALSATVDPANATERKVTWSTSDATVATVADGKVTAKSAGTVTITAKAGDKEATCIVTVAARITSISELSNTVLYAVSQPNHSNGATSWAVQEDGQALKSNHDLGLDIHGADTRQQFAFVSNDGGATHYLYHVAEAKFVNKDGSLGDKPVDKILFKTGAYLNTFVAYFDFYHYVNVGGIRQMTIDYWNTPDGGNSCVISPVGVFDPTEALKAFNTDGIEMPTGNGQQATVIYDLMGRRVETPIKGVYIVNGRKVVIR